MPGFEEAVLLETVRAWWPAPDTAYMAATQWVMGDRCLSSCHLVPVSQALSSAAPAIVYIQQMGSREPREKKGHAETWAVFQSCSE